jgi:putative tryptophan/tyrosine transport system substrate-binding protein
MRLWRVSTAIALTLGLGVATHPADAQQSTKVPRIGMLGSGAAPQGPNPNAEALRQGMRELGWEKVEIEIRYADGKMERLPELAKELAALPVDVFVVGGTPPTRAAKQATSTIPIVVPIAADPVGTGLVTPGGNVAARNLLSPEFGKRQLEVFREIIPGLTRLTVLQNPTNPAAAGQLKQVRAAAEAAGVQVQVVDVRTPEELPGVISAIARERPQGLFALADPMLYGQRQRLVTLAREQGLPTMHQEEDYVVAGGLAAYGPSVVEQYRHAARYVDKILKGAKPAELPVEPITDFRLVINRATAKALGLEVPQAVLARADRVIEGAPATAATGSAAPSPAAGAVQSGAQPGPSPK